jgi:flagellar protein FliO/FliZ
MESISPYLNYVVAALVVIGLLLLLLLIWRAYSQRVRGRRGQRLSISEYHELDQTRRLVLVRRDNVEHLLLIGGPSDLVVESAINSPDRSATVFSDGDLPRPMPIPIRPAPRAPGYGERNPPPLRTGDPEPPRSPRLSDKP